MIWRCKGVQGRDKYRERRGREREKIEEEESGVDRGEHLERGIHVEVHRDINVVRALSISCDYMSRKCYSYCLPNSI